MIWSQEIRNDKPLYLTTNKSGWPPGSRHPIQKLATLSDRTLPSQQGLGYRDASREASGPRRSKVDQQGNHVSAGPGWFKNDWQLTSTHTFSNGKSAWATTRNA